MLNFYELNEAIEFDQDNHGTGGRQTRKLADLPAEDPRSLRDIGSKQPKGDYWMKWKDEPEQEISRHDGTSQELEKIRDKHGVPGADLARQIYHAINTNIGKFQHKAFTFDQLVHFLQGMEIKDVDGGFKKLGVTSNPQQWATAIKLLSGATQPALSTPIFSLNKGSKTISIKDDHPTLSKSALSHLEKLKGPQAKAEFKDRYLDRDEEKKVAGARYTGQVVDPTSSPAKAGELPAVIAQKVGEEGKLYSKLIDYMDEIRTTGYGDADSLDQILAPYEELVHKLLDSSWVKRDQELSDRISQNYNHVTQTSKEIWNHMGNISPEKSASDAVTEFRKLYNINQNPATSSEIAQQATARKDSVYAKAQEALLKALNDPKLKSNPKIIERLGKMKANLEAMNKGFDEFAPELSGSKKPGIAPATPTKTVQAPSVPTKPQAAQPPARRTFKPPAGGKDFSGLERLKQQPPSDPFK